MYYIVWASEGSNLQPILFPLGCSSAVFFFVFGGFEDLSPPSDGDDSTDTQSNIALEQLHFSVEHLLSAKVDDQIVNLHFSHLEVS